MGESPAKLRAERTNPSPPGPCVLLPGRSTRRTRRCVHIAAARVVSDSPGLTNANPCAQAKAKNAQQMEEMQAMGKDRDELRAKFEAKSREKRLLEDKLHALAAENQALKSGGPPAALHHHDAQHEASLAAAAALHPSGHMGAASALLHPQGQHFATHRTMNAGPGGGGGIVTQTRSIHATQHFEYTTTGGGGGGGGGGSGGGLIGAKRPAAVAGLGVQFQRLGGRSPGNSGGGLLPGGVHRVVTTSMNWRVNTWKNNSACVTQANVHGWKRGWTDRLTTALVA